MKISFIEVKKLFGTYNYRIEFKKDEKVTILHAPNGYGKTTILRLIKATMEGDMLYLDDTPFESLELSFDTGDYIKVIKDDIFDSFFNSDFRSLRNEMAHLSEEKAIPIHYNISGVPYELFLNPAIVLNMYKQYYTQSTLMAPGLKIPSISFAEKILDDSLNREIFKDGVFFKMLDAFSENVQINLIESNRLFKSRQEAGELGRGRMPDSIDRFGVVDTVEVYSRELKDRITKVRNEIGNLSDEMDRSFPNRVLDSIINQRDYPVLSIEEIRDGLNELESKRKELEALGLINEGRTASIPENADISIDARKILSVYVEDNRKKLSVYDEIKDKIDILTDIINLKNQFSNKKMKIDKDRGIIFLLDNEREVPLNKLSSGEKNDFILFYELLFKSKENSIILIDEPEISLHITWQQEFIRELIHICDINGLQAVVATHSPHIVDEYWDLMVDLEGED